MLRRTSIVAVALWSLCCATTARGMTVEEALELAKKTGRPIFAMSGSKDCGACIAMAKQLGGGAYSDVLSNFITLKFEQSTPEWQKWVSLYKSEGNSIPILYVVRGDGTQLYGQSAGGLSGTALREFLRSQLAQAGTILQERQLAKMSEAVEKAKNHKQNGEIGLAVATLAPQLGSGSFAQVAVEAEALGAELQKEGETAIEAAAAKLAIADEAFEGAVEFLAAKRHFGRLPALKTLLAAKQREVAGTPEAKAALKAAAAIDKAAELAEKGNKKGAATAYRKIVDKESDSPAAELAQARLAELN